MTAHSRSSKLEFSKAAFQDWTFALLPILRKSQSSSSNLEAPQNGPVTEPSVAGAQVNLHAADLDIYDLWFLWPESHRLITTDNDIELCAQSFSDFTWEITLTSHEMHEKHKKERKQASRDTDFPAVLVRYGSTDTSKLYP